MEIDGGKKSGGWKKRQPTGSKLANGMEPTLRPGGGVSAPGLQQGPACDRPLAGDGVHRELPGMKYSESR